MRLHDRYLFRELLTPLAGCLGGFMVFWISFFFFTRLEEMRAANLHFFDSVEFAAAELPAFFVLALPITLLLALLYALTHHARHHELTALRAAGISLWRICLPYFLIGLAASLVSGVLNEAVVPRCADWSAEILSRHAKNKLAPPSPGLPLKASGFSHLDVRRARILYKSTGFYNPQTRRSWEFGEYNAATTEIVNPLIKWTLPNGDQRHLWSEHGCYTNGVWTFFKVQLFTQSGPKGRLIPQASTNQLALPEFTETPRQVFLQLKFADKQTLGGSQADIPLTELWEYLRFNPGFSGEDASRLLTKFHGRLAAPWTCLVVVFIAVPFGAASGRRNLFFGVAGSIFIGFTFFVLQQVCLALGLGGTLPGWVAAWLPNFIFALAGIFLISRTR